MWWIAVLAAVASEPVELREGVQYAAGTRVQVAALGVSFQVPEGWGGGLPPGGDSVLLASDTFAGLVLASAEEGVGLEEARLLMGEPLQLDAMTVLLPGGAPVVSGKDLRQSYGAGELVGHARARVTDRAGVVFVAMGPRSDDARISALSDTLMGSLREHAAPAPLAPAGDVAAALAGQQIYYLKVKNGFSDEWHAYLCSHGVAIWSANQSGMSTGGGSTLSVASQGADRGTWTVQGSQLVIQWNDGTTGTWTVTHQGGTTTVSADNTWVQPQDVCP